MGPTGETLYLNDGGVMSERLAGSGGTVEWTDYLFAAEEMIGMRVEHSVSGVYTRYFQKDHLNSIAVITDEAGAVVEQLSYDAWGKRRYAANGSDDPAGSITSQTNRGFTGHEQLEEVGLVHMNGRVYDPLIGRFTSADPVTPEPYTTQSWNRYTYAANNPLRFIDPTGHNYNWSASIPGWPGTGSSGGSGTPNDNTLTGSTIAQGQDRTEKEQSTGVRGMANDEPLDEKKALQKVADAYGIRVEGQLVVGIGGKFTIEISVDPETGEIRGAGSVGGRLGLKGKGDISGFVEPSSKKGNSARASAVVSAEASAEINTGLAGGIGISSNAKFGGSTDGLVTPNADDLLDVSGHIGPFSIDENGRKSFTVGAGLGGSVGTEYSIDASISVPDTVDAVTQSVEDIRGRF